jgi:hypothetical protein
MSGELASALQSIAQNWQLTALGQNSDGTTRVEASALEQAYKFYRREANDFTALGPEEVAAEEREFHDVLARLAGHPIMLRALGLLMDFGVAVADLAAAGGRNELRLEPRWPNPDPNAPAEWRDAAQNDLAPRTACAVVNTRFVALSEGAALRSPGMLPLAGTGLAGGTGTNTRFEIMPFDVDGAALRMFSTAQSDRGQPPDSALATAGLPALRSMGFALVEKTRRSEHDARLGRARDRDTPAKLTASPLTAENLIAGYRVDVFDKGTWRSLCQRRVRYIVDGVQIPPASASGKLLEEGFVRLDGATTGSGVNDVLYIHETVARWDGWSSVIPRPERVDDPIVDPTPPPFHVQAEVETGSLPLLKFGRKYKLRARLVDLAGGGLRRTQPGASEEASNEVVHRRFEPLIAPELVPTAAYVDGAGQALMVIRSDRGISAADYAAAHGYRPVDLRYLFAAKSSLGLAMQHPKAFDTALGPNVTPAELERQFSIAKRADNDLGKVDGAQLIDGGDDSGKYYIVGEQEWPKLPWLADFASEYISIRCRSRPINPKTNLEGETVGFDKLQYIWRGDWPSRVPIALKVVEAREGCIGSHSATADQRTIKVELGAAEQVTIDMLSCPDQDYVPWLGVAKWAGASDTDTCHAVNDSVYRGCNPLVTPPRTITMVHAVQRPLVDPTGGFIANRAMGNTHVILGTSSLKLHIPSTGRIDVQAAWSDIEDIAPAQPRRNSVVANVGSYDIAHKPPLLAPPHGAFPVIRQEFGDVRRRRVTYTLTAISRFRDFFGRITMLDPQACSVRATLNITDVKAATRPPTPKVRLVLPTFRWSRSDQGNVIRSSRRAGGLRVLLERPWFVTGEDEALAVVAWPQSAQPPVGRELRNVTLAGRDPLFTTANTHAPAAIVNQTHVNAAASQSVKLPELDRPVFAMITPVDFDRNFDREADCWFADIDLSPLVEKTYFPFVRLSLCRYQDHIADLDQRLSTPIQTEPLQLFPHRDLTVTRNPGKAIVVVNDPNPAGPKPTEIEAQLQVFTGDPRAADAGLIGPSAWTMLKRAAGRLGDSLQLEIPPAERRPLRIAVTENESYVAGAGSPSRIVYADTVNLPASA